MSIFDKCERCRSIGIKSSTLHGDVFEGVSEEGVDFSVMGVGFRDPVGAISLDVSPEDFRKVLVGELAWVESVNGFNDILSCVAILNGSGNDFLCGEFVEDLIEVLELNGMISEEAGVDSVQGGGPVSS